MSTKQAYRTHYSMYWLCILLALLTVPANALEIPAKPPSHVVDLAEVIDLAYEQKLNAFLTELGHKTTANIVVLTVHTTAGESIEQFSLHIANDLWKLGDAKENNGLLVLIAVKDRRYRIEVGVGLEKTLPDEFCHTVGEQYFVPNFRAGNFGKGIYEGTLALANEVAKHYDVEGGDTASNDRLVLDAKVNGESVRLGFDTGAEVTILFRQTVKRLRLNVTEPPANTKAGPGKLLAGRTEECRFELGNFTTKARFRVFDLPQYIDPGMDGVLAWADFRDNIVGIAADINMLSPLTALPENMDQWTKWNIRQDSRYLEVILPLASGKEGTILIDTGSPFGVQLSPERWKQWRDKYRDQSVSIQAEYTPGIGLKVYEEAWADSLSIVTPG